MRNIAVTGFVAAIAVAAPASAQTSALVGTVMRDTLGHAMGGGVEIRIPQLNGGATTNYMGEFRITRIPPGTYLVTVRSVGFEPVSDSITFVANQAVTREFVLKPIATQLDPVKTQAQGARKYVSPNSECVRGAAAFGQGRLLHRRQLMRASDNNRLSDVLGRIPGLQKDSRPRRSRTSRRRGSRTDGGPVFPGEGPGSDVLPVTIYINGVMRWQGPSSATNPPLDMNTINVSELAGAEYYAGGAAMPVQYNKTRHQLRRPAALDARALTPPPVTPAAGPSAPARRDPAASAAA